MADRVTRTLSNVGFQRWRLRTLIIFMGLAVGGGAADYILRSRPRRLSLFVQNAVIKQKALERLPHICDEPSFGIGWYLLGNSGIIKDYTP